MLKNNNHEKIKCQILNEKVIFLIRDGPSIMNGCAPRRSVLSSSSGQPPDILITIQIKELPELPLVPLQVPLLERKVQKNNIRNCISILSINIGKKNFVV